MQHFRKLTPASEEYSSSWVQEQPLTLPRTSPIWWTLIIGLSPVPPYNLNLYNYNMHDLEKKLFRLEELLFLSLQTSLTKYISSMIDCNNK